MSRKSSIPHEISQNAIKTLWPEFSAITKARMVAGMRTYGDDSFHRPAQSLADEVLEEIVDIQGWSFILWCRVRKLKQKMELLEDLTHQTEDNPPDTSLAAKLDLLS